MRVLVASVPALGHVNPLIPLARGLRDAGHEVVWATAEPIRRRLEAAGFTARIAGPPMGEWEMRLAQRTRGRPGDGIRPERTPYWFAPRLFGEVGTALLIDDLLAVARDFEPDVILFESRCYAAPVVARLVGALPVLRTVTTLFPPAVEELVSEAVTPLWRELGLDPPTFAGVFDGLTFSAYPAALDDPSPYPGLVVHRLRPAAAEEAEPAWLGPWLQEQAGRPLVYATLGTVFGDRVPLLSDILAALTRQDVAVLLTVGPGGDPGSLVARSARVRIERYVPQDAVLPHCAIVVSHGGSGTFLGALGDGLPHVAIPQGADQFINARNAGAHGFGRALLPPAVTADDIAAAVGEVLAEGRYRRAAEALRDQMLAGLSTDEAVDLIEAAVR